MPEVIEPWMREAANTICSRVWSAGTEQMAKIIATAYVQHAARDEELRPVAENALRFLELIAGYGSKTCGEVKLITVQFDEKSIQAEIAKIKAALAAGGDG